MEIVEIVAIAKRRLLFHRIPTRNPRIPLVPLIMIHNCRLEVLIDFLVEIL